VAEAAGDGDHVSTHAGSRPAPLFECRDEAVAADHGARDHTGPMPAKVRASRLVKRTDQSWVLAAPLQPSLDEYRPFASPCAPVVVPQFPCFPQLPTPRNHGAARNARRSLRLSRSGHPVPGSHPPSIEVTGTGFSPVKPARASPRTAAPAAVGRHVLPARTSERASVRSWSRVETWWSRAVRRWGATEYRVTPQVDGTHEQCMRHDLSRSQDQLG
jgi:hypothetical protein